MSVKNGKDFLYLIWKNPTTRQQYTIGFISKNGGYDFEYGKEIHDAISDGFEPLVAFADINKKYHNDTLFPVFSSRLPDKKRKDINVILEKYNLKEYDEYALLKRSHGILPIDNFEFIDPIFDNEKKVDVTFTVAGSRHYLGCNSETCENAINIKVNDLLRLQPEPENKYDSFAIKINTENNDHIGYIPRYYSESVFNRLKDSPNIICRIIEFQKDRQKCSDCVKARLLIE